MRRVFAAVHEVAWPTISKTEDRATEVMLRTLISYCYVRGICRSNDVELAAEEDPAVRYLTGNTRPRAGEIRRFRRRNVEPLKKVLGMLISSEKAEQAILGAIRADSADLDE